ncbi:MAG: hypothetical protein IH600_01180 [Bacteroidetes bacterium]|nr:hypothetical protein [Bacteroidota bacterium]
MIGIMLIGLGFSSCGQNSASDKNAADGSVTEQTTQVPGTLTETPEFTILVPEGWEASDFGGGAFQTYNKSGSYMVEVRKAGVNMTEKDVESTLQALVTQYKGTPIKTVDMKGMKYFTSTYEANGRHQTMYNGLKGGAKISISLVGPDHETDPTIQGVLSSIVVK